MDSSFVCKLCKDGKLLGTAFFIRTNTLYTANHCFKDIKKEEYSKCYIECWMKKYYISEVKSVDELDFAQITLDNDVSEITIPEISTECLYPGERICGYGYKKVNRNVQGVHMKLKEYPLDNNEKADCCFMIENEEDGARWYGISGGPIYSEKLLRGMIIKNYGGDGLSTRIEVVSFNKIIKYFVDNNMDEFIENFPQTFVNSELYKRIEGNRKKCEKLYYSSDYTYECTNVQLVINFFKTHNKVNINVLLDELKNSIIEYALSLDEKYSTSSYINTDKIQMITNRVNEVTERIKGNFNSVYIMLWMLTEGIISAPRIARVLVKQDSKYIEEDIYLKKGDGKINLLIPIVSADKNIFKSIFNIITTVDIRKRNGLIQLNDIEWDEQAIRCLDIKSSVEIGKIIRNEYNKGVTIDITALVLYNSEVYSSIPKIINTEERIKEFFNDNFKKDFNNQLQEYKVLTDKMNEVNDIKINLFILPVTDVNGIENI